MGWVCVYDFLAQCGCGCVRFLSTVWVCSVSSTVWVCTISKTVWMGRCVRLLVFLTQCGLGVCVYDFLAQCGCGCVRFLAQCGRGCVRFLTQCGWVDVYNFWYF